MSIDEAILEIKRAAQCPEMRPGAVRKGALLAALRAMRALDVISQMPVGRNYPAETARMREVARVAMGRGNA